MVSTFGPVKVDLNSVFVADAVFTAQQFASSGRAMLGGPLSLRVSITNNLTAPILFGLVVETTDGIIQIADRVHLGFVARESTATITPASVPALAEIRGTIKKVTVRLYRFSSLISVNTTVQVYLFADDAQAQAAPMEFIGSDTAVWHPGIHTSYSIGGLTLPAGAADDIVLTTAGILAPFRFRLTTITLVLFHMPFPADTRLRVFITRYFAAGGFMSEITRVHSRCDGVAQLVLPGEWYINSGDAVSVAGTNNNVGLAGGYEAILSGDVVF